MLAPEVLVLGASGRVGAGVVAALLEAGSPVLAVGRDPQRLQALAETHSDEPGLETLVGSVAGDRQAADLARRVAERQRPLRAVVDAIAAPRRSARLLEHPVVALRRSLDQGLLPHLAAARHLLPLLREQAGAPRYVLVGGPHAQCGWAGYGHASVTAAATRMLAQVLNEEAQAMGVRLQLLSVGAPVWTADNAAHACAGWHSALGVGRGVVALLASAGSASPSVVEYRPAAASTPAALLASDCAAVLRAASGASGTGQVA